MEFSQLGFDPVFEVSAEHGHGVAELLDEIAGRLETMDSGPAAAVVDPQPLLEETSVAIVGRPNVGKSSLVNRLLREERVLVSDMPGTTRDAIDAVLTWHRRRFRIVDTAGMRASRPRRPRREGGVCQRGRGEEVDCGGGRRGAGDRCCHRSQRSGRRYRWGSRPRRPRHRAVGEQVGPREEPGLELRQDVRRAAAPRHAVSGLRADPSHLGADRGAHTEGARGDRQNRGRQTTARFRLRPSTNFWRRSPQSIRRSAPAASMCGSCMRRRSASPRPRSSFSPTSRRRFISRTNVCWSIGYVKNLASWARRSGSRSVGGQSPNRGPPAGRRTPITAKAVEPAGQGAG